MKARCFALASVLVSAAACSATPPAHWAQGGAILDIPKARWVVGPTVVDVSPNGSVLVNGELELSVDRGGRVVDQDREPVALLEPDGKVVGPDAEPLGTVGAMHAARPGEDHAWLSLAPSGEVLIYDDEGERALAGVWIGCNVSPRAHQTCTLLTHLLAMKMKALAERREPGVGIGIGVGVGIPIR